VPFLLANLSALNSSIGRYADALAGLDEAPRADPETPYVARRHQQRAFALAKLGRRDEALAEVSLAVELSKTRGTEEVLGPPQLRAQLLAELGRFDEAEADLRGVLGTIERVRANTVPSDLMRRGFGQVHQAVFATAIDVLGLQHKAEAALQTAEQARARAFLDLRAEQVKAGVAPATVADAQRQAVRLQSTIIAYWVGPTTLSIWVVRPGQPVRLVRVSVLSTRLTTLVRATAGVDAGGAARGGLLMTDRAQRAPWRELEALVMAPIAKWLPAQPGSRLTIVPHGPLFGLSFAGLRDASGRYLLERHDLHYVPAIAVLSAAGPHGSATTGALLVGDPGRLEGEAGAEALPALPWARREVEAVRGTLGAPTTLLTGDDATEGRVRTTLAGRRVLHFATHGVVSNEPNQPSYLALHAAPGDDGRFSADEIYGSTIDADLVVLSACRTALGPVEGDGVIGFTRAFLSAGARSVVATQWDVSDQVSYDVMRGFYARRARGLSTSRALRGAQLAVLRRLRAGTVVADGVALPETPRLWAGFILTGEP
jgi:CHAT domain-containing protein